MGQVEGRGVVGALSIGGLFRGMEVRRKDVGASKSRQKRLEDAKNDEGRVVALGGTGGEGVGGLDDLLDDVFGGKAVAGFDGVEQTLLGPFF